MKTTPIKDSWGCTIEFDNPMDFFQYDKNYWRNMLYEKKIIIFKRMTFKVLDFAKFGTYFGSPWAKSEYAYSNEHGLTCKDIDKNYSVSWFSSLLTGIPNTDMAWHSDIPNRSYNPYPHRALWIIKNPNPEMSGKTKWLNVEDCFEYLTPEMKDLLPRVKIEQQSWYKPGTDIRTYDFIKTQPITGKLSLRLNYYNTDNITGAWIKSVYIDNKLQPDCSLIKMFIEHLEQIPELVHYHQWDNYDVAIYDNWSFLHGRTALQLGNTPLTSERAFYRINIDHVSNDEWNNQNI